VLLSSITLKHLLDQGTWTTNIHNTFRYCRLRFCWTTFLETAVYLKVDNYKLHLNVSKKSIARSVDIFTSLKWDIKVALVDWTCLQTLTYWILTKLNLKYWISTELNELYNIYISYKTLHVLIKNFLIIIDLSRIPKHDGTESISGSKKNTLNAWKCPPQPLSDSIVRAHCSIMRERSIGQYAIKNIYILQALQSFSKVVFTSGRSILYLSFLLLTWRDSEPSTITRGNLVNFSILFIWQIKGMFGKLLFKSRRENNGQSLV